MNTHEKEVLKQQLKELSDREIQERLLLENIEKSHNIKSIYQNVQFFFWITLISLIITFLIILINFK